MKTGLYIGRFQPLHHGHMDAIKQALSHCDYLLITIGSTVENFQPENPFTLGERIEMLKTALDEKKISTKKYAIYAVTNINNFALWPQHVEQSLPAFEMVFTASPIVKELFEKYTKHEIINLKKNLKISSTLVRAAIIKNQNWSHLVLPTTQKLLNSWNAEKRLQSINS